MSRNVASRRVMSRHVALCRIMSRHFTSFYVMSRHVTSCHVMPRDVLHVTLCHVMSRHVMSYHVMSRHVTSCHVTSCHVLPRHVTSRHVTSCYVISRRKSWDGHASTNASLSTDFFHTQSIQIKHDRVRWLSRRLPIQYRISGIWSSFIYVMLCYVKFVYLLMRLSSCLIKGNLLTYLLASHCITLLNRISLQRIDLIASHDIAGDSHVSLRLRMSAGFAISSLSREGDLSTVDCLQCLVVTSLTLQII